MRRYTANFFEGKIRKNNGELPQYYIEQNENTSFKVKEIQQLITSESIRVAEYSDSLIYRIIEKITVISKEEILIRFVGGYEMT